MKSLCGVAFLFAVYSHQKQKPCELTERQGTAFAFLSILHPA